MKSVRSFAADTETALQLFRGEAKDPEYMLQVGIPARTGPRALRGTKGQRWERHRESIFTALGISGPSPPCAGPLHRNADRPQRQREPPHLPPLLGLLGLSLGGLS